MTQRGGFDVVDCIYIAETEATFGTTPTTGTWLPVWVTKLFDAKMTPIWKDVVGVGSQVVRDQIMAKSYYEFRIEYELLKKETSPAFNWVDFFKHIVASPLGYTPTNQILPFSLSAKMDLATDEFWWLKGCKQAEHAIIGTSIDDLVRGEVSGIAQDGTYSTTDPVSGTATRQAMPDWSEAGEGLISFGECDVLYDPTTPATIMEDLSKWALRIRRTINRRGTKSTTYPKLYRAFVPVAREYILEITKDFDSLDELEDYLAGTEMKATLKIPSATGGIQFALTGGKWKTMGKPIRERDLIDLTLTGSFKTCVLSDIT